MRSFMHGDRKIEVIDFDDIAVEQRVVEFRCASYPDGSSFAAVIVPDEGGWQTASLSIAPQCKDLSVVLVEKMIQVARQIIDNK